MTSKKVQRLVESFRRALNEKPVVGIDYGRKLDLQDDTSQPIIIKGSDEAKEAELKKAFAKPRNIGQRIRGNIGQKISGGFHSIPDVPYVYVDGKEEKERTAMHNPAANSLGLNQAIPLTYSGMDEDGWGPNLKESYTLSELNEVFEALGLNTRKYTTEYLAEEMGFKPLKERSASQRAAERIYKVEELLEAFTAAGFDTRKYNVEYLAEQLGFERVEVLQEGAKEVMKKVWDGTKWVMKKVVLPAAAAYAGYKMVSDPEFLPNAVSGVGSAINAIGTAVKPYADAAGNFVSSNIIKPVGEVIGTAGKMIGDGVESAADSAGNLIKKGAENVHDNISTVLGGDKWANLSDKDRQLVRDNLIKATWIPAAAGSVGVPLYLQAKEFLTD